ncbi:MAG TPA: DinB family protein [candidate division Zixibacteria bacterium]|nr:DinB family protein [candidate division Zixibacteria bacterium]
MTRSARWWEALAGPAPDVVACWLALDQGPIFFRREVRRRSGPGTAMTVLAQQEAVADALADALHACTDEMLRAPGGEEDWNVAQAFAHTTAARRWLARAAALAASGAWPEPAPVVRPGVPGPADATREQLLTYLDKSRRSMAESAAAIAGHEADPCPLDHPLVGRLRCGEWLLFAGVHDLMHLEQLHRLIGDG